MSGGLWTLINIAPTHSPKMPIKIKCTDRMEKTPTTIGPTLGVNGFQNKSLESGAPAPSTWAPLAIKIMNTAAKREGTENEIVKPSTAIPNNAKNG